MRAYLDCCLCVYMVEQPPGFGALIRAKIAEQRPRICWSPLTYMECRVKPLRDRDVMLLKKYENFFELPDNIYLGIEYSTFKRAAELRARHDLKTPDALHLATAIEGGCEEFWTNDHRLDSAASDYLNTVTL